MYPDRDYLILTQPHTVAEGSLLSKFTQPLKKPNNTFSHVLYILHRDALEDLDLFIRRAKHSDLDQITMTLTIDLEDKKEVDETVQKAIFDPESKNMCFVAKIEETIVGVFVMSKDVNLAYYKSHFHIQDNILLSEHERKGHSRLVYSIINPIFIKSTRFCLKEVLRLTAKTCLYFEISDRTVLPTIFHELINVRSRRFPHFLKWKWNHERNIYEN